MKTTKQANNKVVIEKDGIEWSATTYHRIEWRKDGQLVKKERVPKRVRECAIAASGVLDDETIVGGAER